MPPTQHASLDLSVITATHDRPSALANCISQFQKQSLGNLKVEHVIVSDGADAVARSQALSAGARYFELPASKGHAGAYAKDVGIAQAKGRYICFWDDDNIYEPHALATLYAAAHSVDIGVVQTRHRLRKNIGTVLLPRMWKGSFQFGDIDTMCVCVKRELAHKACWGDENNSVGTDYRWLKKLEAFSPVIRYVPIQIGQHV